MALAMAKGMVMALAMATGMVMASASALASYVHAIASHDKFGQGSTWAYRRQRDRKFDARKKPQSLEKMLGWEPVTLTLMLFLAEELGPMAVLTVSPWHRSRDWPRGALV